MDTEIERRIYECINGVELEKGPVTTELMSKRISIKQVRISCIIDTVQPLLFFMVF